MSTLVDLIRRRADEHPDRRAYVYLADGETDEQPMTFGDLELRARSIAVMLREHGIEPGDRVLLLYPPGLDYLGAFYGCLFAGAVAVPAYPPRPKGPMTRLDAIVEDAQATAALTTSAILEGVRQQLGSGFDSRVERWIATDGVEDRLGSDWRDPEVGPESLAFLQYTSGSTSTPKGVIVSHGNLMANQEMIRVAFEHTEESTFVGWLPMFHDMGLIGHVIQPLYVGSTSVLMAPIAFVQRPIRWLRAIDRYRGRTGGAPNFAYDLCVVKTTPEQRDGLDLSSWSLAFNGSETVRSDTVDRFIRTFEPFGVRPEIMYPCYGLAEATLFVTGGSKADEPLVRSFRTEELEQRRAVAAEPDSEGSRELVGCGHSWLDQRVVIADPETGEQLPDGRIGEIWISGDNVALGYWGREDATEELFRARLAGSDDGPFLRTGDLGFLDSGELFISGRIKDMIIVRGRNHYPQDIELTSETSHPVLRRGCSAAFSMDVDGEERVGVVQEVSRRFRDADLDEVVARIRQRITEEHDLATHAVVLIKPGHIPKTSSGKIQRSLTRRRYESGDFEILHESVLEGGEAVSKGAPQASLLQQTLVSLGPVGGKAVLEAHLEERVGAFGVDALSGLDSDGRRMLHGAIETELGLPVNADVVQEAADFGELAERLVALVAAASPDTTPDPND